MSDPEDKLSSSVSFLGSEQSANTRSPITIVATCLDNQQLIAYAKDDGTVEVYDLLTNVRHVVAQSAFGMGVKQLALSRDGKHVAYCLFNGRITVKTVDLSSKPGSIVTGVVYTEKIRIDRGAIREILFDNKSRRVFIHGLDELQVVDISTGALLTSKTTTDSLPRERTSIWDYHPTDDKLLLRFTATEITAYSWADLEPVYQIPIDVSHKNIFSDLPPTSFLSLEAMPHSYHPNVHLAIVSFEGANTKVCRFLLLDNTVLQQEQHEKGDKDKPPFSIYPLVIPASIADHIEYTVGVLRDGRLVFVDANLWVCTAQLLHGPGPDNALKRHFFVPRDWLNSAGLMLCRVQRDGTFLCPNNGEMAVIKSDVGTGW